MKSAPHSGPKWSARPGSVYSPVGCLFFFVLFFFSSPFFHSITPACALHSLPTLFSLVATATTGRPSLPPYAPGAKVFFGPFVGDEHHQVRPPLGLPFLLCETDHANPNRLFIFGSDPTTSVYA